LVFRPAFGRVAFDFFRAGLRLIFFISA
jgi:hypothetical protein